MNNQKSRNDIIFIVSTSALLFSWAITSILVLDNLTILLITFAYIVVILGIEFLFLFLINKISLDKYRIILLSLIVAFNAICIFFHLSTLFMLLSILNKFIFLIILIIFIYIIIFLFLKRKNLKIFFLTFVFSVVFFNIVIKPIYYVFYENKHSNEKIIKIKKNYILNSNVEFHSTPDIYVFIFDAMVPDYITEKNLGFKTSYNKYIKENLTTINNFFSDFASTLHTLNSFLYLDNQKWLLEQNKNDFITGKKNSPLFDVFKNNGYKVAVSYKAFSFASATDYLDLSNHHKKKIIKDKIYINYCDWQSHLYFLRFFGICLAYELFEDSKVVDDYFVASISESKERWFVLNYYNKPGHAPLRDVINNDLELREYKKKFKKKSNDAYKILKNNLSVIKKSKKDSIILVFGDHGLMLSDSEKFSFNHNKMFVLEDLFITSGAYYDEKGICNNLSDKFQNKFVTPIQLGRNLINCLAKKDVFITKPDLNLVYGRINNDELIKINLKKELLLDYFKK